MPTLDQKIATGFNRNHRGNSEGGIIPEEYAVGIRRRSRGHDVDGVPGPDAGLCALPQPQVRPDHAEGVLSAVRLLQQRARAREGRRVGNSPPYIAAPLPEQQAQLKQLDDRAGGRQRRLREAAAGTGAGAAANGNGRWTRPAAWHGRRPAAWWRTIRSTATSTPQVAVLQEAKGPRSCAALTRRRATAGCQRHDAAACAERLRPAGSGRRRASTARASFNRRRHRRVRQLRLGRGALGANDPTVTYDDAYTMAAWIYPTAPTGAIVTRDERCRSSPTDTG